MPLYCIAPSTLRTVALSVTGTLGIQQGAAMAGNRTTGVVFGGRRGYGDSVGNFVRYTRSGNNITYTTLTKAGAAIRSRHGAGIAGDTTSGVIFGGQEKIGSVDTRLNDWHSYSISGDTVTFTALTVSGVTIPATQGLRMAGNATTGIIFGGVSSPDSPNFYRYVVSGNTVTVTTLTKAGTSSIATRRGHGMIGDATQGLIYGGYTAPGLTYIQIMTRYSVSSTTITLTDLTTQGTVMPPPWQGVRLTGDMQRGMIFGGARNNPFARQFAMYRYEIVGDNVTFTSMSNQGAGFGTGISYSIFGDADSGLFFNNGAFFSYENAVSVASQVYCGPTEARNVTCGGARVIGSRKRYRFTDLMEAGATVSLRRGAIVAGTATTGILYGGRSLPGSPQVFHDDFYRYVVSGSTATLTALTVTGDTTPLTSFQSAVVGDVTSGMLFGGRSAGATSNFYNYTITSNTVNVVQLTKAGTGSSISSRRSPLIVGGKTAGIVGGGWQATVRTDFFRYSISSSTITLTTLTVNGYPTGNIQYNTMVGDATRGVMFGGNNRADPTSLYDDFYRYEASGNTLTFTLLTKIGDPISARFNAVMIGDRISGIVFGGTARVGGANVDLNDLYYYAVEGNNVFIQAVDKIGAAVPARAQFYSISGGITNGLIYGFGNANDFFKYEVV